MRMLLILVLAGALALGGYLTRPNEDAHRKHANELLAGEDADDLGKLIDGLLGDITRDGEFEDLMVATRYTVRSGDKVLVECLGVFGQFFCSQPEKK